MPGSFLFIPEPVPLARPSRTVAVFRRVGTAEYLLPNVVPLHIQYRDGAFPGVANFRYVLDDIAAAAYGSPSRIEQVYSLDASGPFVVANDDRLVVRVLLADGRVIPIFDGFAQVPKAELSERTQAVSFQALGRPIRGWDTPIGGAIYRDADDPIDGRDVRTMLPARFNPRGKEGLSANATPDTGDVNADQRNAYPVFIDPAAPGADDDHPVRPWTLEMAVRYILYANNSFELNVDNPPASLVTGVLKSLAPAEEGGPIDPKDPDTYTENPILLSDVDVTGLAWPEAVEKLITPHGFGMRFILDADSSGNPTHRLAIYRKDDVLRVRSLYLQPIGSVLDPGQTNVQAMNLARDTGDLFNCVVVDTAPTAYEVSVLLAPGFAIDAGDAAAAKTKWQKGEADFDPIKYRRYVFAEDGSPHWEFAEAALVTDATSLAVVFGDPKLSEAEQEEQYVSRARPGRGTCFSVDADGRPRKAELWVCTDVEKVGPCVWGRQSGEHWQRVSSGDWKLLDDRLGIELTCKDIRNWNVGESKVTNAPFPSGKVDVVASLVTSDATNPLFYFRLTAVIESDAAIDTETPRRFSSPTKYEVTRHFDCRDRFGRDLIDASSHFNLKPVTAVSRDDTADAVAYAQALQRAHDVGTFGGSVTIPRFSLDYLIGDKVDGIRGRGIDLRTNAGTEQGEGLRYPTVVGLTWVFEGGQKTILDLSDSRDDPALPLQGGA